MATCRVAFGVCGERGRAESWQASRLGEPFVEQVYRLAPQDNALESTGEINRLQMTALGSLGDLLYFGTDNGVWLNDAGKWTHLGLEGKIIYTMAIDEKTQSLWVSACGTQNDCQVSSILKVDGLNATKA